MNTLAKILVFLLISPSIVNAQETNGQEITVVIENLNSNKGEVYVSLYNTEASFLGKGFKSTKSKIVNNSCTIKFENV